MCSTIADLGEASTGQLVTTLAAIAAELAHRPPPDSPAACLDLTETLATAIDQTESALAALIGVVDRAGEAQRWGYPSTQAWLRSRLGMRDARAKERITLARNRDRLPRVTARWAAGTLSFGYAATIATAVARLDDQDCAAAEEILLALADQDCSAGKVASFGTRIREVIADRDDSETPDPDTRRGYARSWVDSTRSLDGGRYIKGWLNAEDAAVWDGTLAPLAKPAGPDDHRDLSERTAAAMTAVLAGGHRATRVTVLCDLDTLTGGTTPARLPDGTPIPAEQARRIALNAGVSALLLSSGHHPIYLGRTVRIATPAQRRVLEALYPTCAVQGCEVPGQLCEVDHVHGWALGHSPTDIDQLALCCGWHNRYKHTHPDRLHITHHPNSARYTYRLHPPGHTPANRPKALHSATRPSAGGGPAASATDGGPAASATGPGTASAAGPTAAPAAGSGIASGTASAAGPGTAPFTRAATGRPPPCRRVA
ncbi:DUF222 domain-containing protein [Actinomadura sp. 1N219]|uniref:HNH endonuclease signature motif containing protein n=1 Tax=Actinomadura sp. 1N219 TaxID=3375152 RepID=UPI003791790B